MKYDRSIGVIVFKRFPRSLKYLVLKHSKGHWAFPKGHADKGETKLETAKRELKEETGIKRITLISKRVLLKEEYVIRKEDKRIHKTVEYFIAETATDKVKIDGDEILNYKWCTPEGAQKLLTFPQSKRLAKKAHKLVLKYSDK